MYCVVVQSGLALAPVGHIRVLCDVTACSTGTVMLKECFEKLVQPTMVCPVTDKAFEAADVLQLQAGRSSYAASGPVVAKKANVVIQ